MSLLKKMVVAIIWFAKIKIARQTFVGFAWDLGSLMEVPGIIATGNLIYYCHKNCCNSTITIFLETKPYCNITLGVSQILYVNL